MTTPYDDEDGPWGRIESAESDNKPNAPIRPIGTEPAAQNMPKGAKQWLRQIFGFTGELSRLQFLIAIIIPLVILVPYTAIIAQYFMENAEILQQKSAELGFFSAITYMLEQMIKGFSPMQLWLYNAFTILQYVAYWILMVACVKRFKNAGLTGIAPWIMAIAGVVFVFPLTIIVALLLPTKNKRR